MAKILFHCGAHKTASTHFQHILEINSEYLESKNIKYLKFQLCGLQNKAIELRDRIKDKDYDLAPTVEYIKNRINTLIEGYDWAIISYEGALGPMNTSRSKTIYPDYKELIEQYKLIFEGHEVTPVFVTRNYVDYVLSVYKWQVRYGRPYKLSDYISSYEQDDHRWTKIITTLQDNFPTPIVWTYEEYRKDPNKILNSFFSNFFNSIVDFKDLQMDKEKKNIGADNNTLNLYYTVNRLLGYRYLRISSRKRFNINRNIIDPYISKYNLGKVLPNCMNTNIKDHLDTEQAYKEEVNIIKQNEICICLDNMLV